MKSYREFCARYELDPASPNARHQYRDYLGHAEILRSVVMRHQELETQHKTHPANRPA